MEEGNGTREQGLDELVAMRQRISELETLQRTSIQLTSSLELPNVLDSIAESALALVGASDCLIYLYDEASESFTFGTALGRWAEKDTVIAPRPSGLTATVVREGRPVVINDAVDHPLYASPEVRQWNIQAIAGFPLHWAGRVLGVLHVVFAEPHTFSEEELRILGLLANQAAIAIGNSQLYAQAQQEVAERARAEEELRRHRDHLEELVKERTAALTEANTQLQRANSSLAREITERKQVEAEREQLLAAERVQARRQAALFQLSAELAATIDETEVCRRVVDGLRDTLGYDFVVVLLVDETTAERVLAASTGFDAPPARIPPGRGLSERPLLDGQLHYTPDVTQDPRYFYGVGGSEVDVPVRIGGEVRCVLVAESKRHDGFNQDDFEVLTAAAQQAGLAIEKARLLAAERQRADELDALRMTMADITAELELSALLQAIVERAAGLVDATGGELGLFDEDKQVVRIVVSYNLEKDYVGTYHGLGEGAMGRVAETGEPIIIEDYLTWAHRAPEYADTHVHALLAAPLKVGHRLGGVITLLTTDPERQFGPPDLHLLNLFAQQAAVAIENARLFDQAQREISERERAEGELRKYQEHLEELVEEQTAELRESEERYRTLFDGVPVGLYRTTPEGQILDGNLAFVQMAGYPDRETLLAANINSFYVDSEDRVRWQALIEQEGVVRDFETQMSKFDGTVIWIDDTARAVRDEHGQLLYYEGSIEDITERKQAEEELRKYREHLEELVEVRTAELVESEERYRSLFDGVPVGLYRTTPAGQALDLNRAAVEMFRVPSREDALALKTVNLYVDPKDRVRWQALMEREGIVRDFEYQIHCYDGTVMWINDTARAVKDDQGQVLYYEGILEDITERKKLEEEIRRQKDYFEALFVNNPVAVLTVDLDGNVVSWNPMAEKLFGYTQEEAIGRHVDDLVGSDPRVREEALSYTRQLLTTDRVQATTSRTRKDGSLVDMEVLALPVIVAGEKVGYIGIYVDISELQQARREAEAANQAKSTFLTNMSHELRTPLNAILGFTQLMDGDPNLTAEQQENLGIISRSGEHLLALINDVLEMSKIEAGRVTLQETSFDLYGLLDGLEKMFRLRAEDKGLNLSFRRAENVPQFVRADNGKLRQVLSNLLGNAVKFTREGGVALRVTALSPAQPGEDGKQTLHFEVEDTGPGIASEELAVVFDPFVQATSGRDLVSMQPQEGTGLGLSISLQYVRLMGGDLSVSSEMGQGSLFQFDVPVGSGDMAEVRMVRPERRVLGLAPDQRAADDGPYRLLVVEDRETNRRLLVRLLTDLGQPPLGFEVQEAANGQEAIEIWERWEPHLIWMDMRMPVMDGREATGRIKATPRGQATVIIALTATAFEEDRERILLEGCDDFVRKPFRKNEIYDMLAKHLGVRFVYEEEPARPAVGAPTGVVTRPTEVVTPEKLASLPASWVADLEQATIKADLNQILALIDQVRAQDAALADALADLAQAFEYKKILTLIGKAGGER